MKLLFAVAAIVAGVLVVPAQAATLSCQADRTVSCDAAGCESEAHPDGLPVVLTYDALRGRGELCTYTYCRNVRLLRAPGQSFRGLRLEGFTLSDRSGSVGPDSERSVVDYQLSIAPDQRSFLLGGLAEAGFSGWTGACAPAE